jgi:xanthine dehydrogenase accessory factor
VIRQDLSSRSAALRASRTPFAVARVVLAERPTSAKPGDEAIVLPDGTVEGFVGGGCAEATVRRHALEALASGATVLLRITARPEPGQAGKVIAHNPCLSGGSLEIFVEPSLPPPLVQVVGDSPTAAALLGLGRPLGYDLAPYDGRIDAGAVALVVASHGKDEEAPLVGALEAGVPYVGLVASRRRGPAVVGALPVAPDLRARVRTPAGLDIGAGTAEEIALSILAEIVATRPRAPLAGRPVVAGACMQAPDPEARHETAGTSTTDPVCGMIVTPSQTTHRAEDPVSGHTVWFCGPGCRDAFLAKPGATLGHDGGLGGALRSSGVAHSGVAHSGVGGEAGSSGDDAGTVAPSATR